MTLTELDGLWWLLACFLPFVLVQRWLHREVQAVFLLITRRPDVALGLFSLLFFPGVVLHETSHYITARLLGVRTGRFSVIPQLLADGRLRLGYVETAAADPVRESVIGSAPLLTGGLAIAYLATNALGLSAIAQHATAGAWDSFWQGLAALPSQQDFWLWFYLAFTISSTMLPSASDRRAWLPILVAIAVAAVAALALGGGPWMEANLVPWSNRALRSLALVFGVSLLLHGFLVIPLTFVRLLISRVTGLRVA